MANPLHTLLGAKFQLFPKKWTTVLALKFYGAIETVGSVEIPVKIQMTNL
jgi:hypothetical protein